MRSLNRVVVFCVLLGLLALAQARRHHGHRGGRRRNSAHSGIPRGPICKITDATGSRLYEDPDKCILNSQCIQSALPSITCGNVQATFWFCSPRICLAKGACMVNGRDVGRNCTCGETVYTITTSSQPEESVTIRYCQDGETIGCQRNHCRHRPGYHYAADDEDDEDDDDDDDDQEWSCSALLGQFYNNFDISTCQRAGRPGYGHRGGRRGGRPGGRPGGRQGGHRRMNARPQS